MMISYLINTKNEEDLITGCLNSIEDIADEIIVCDNQSSDRTIEIVKKYTTNIEIREFKNYADNHNFLLQKSKGDWIFYIDADERLSEELKKEINKSIKSSNNSAFAIPRKNILLGKWQRHGGWWPDYQIRLLKKNKLKHWQGELHESPVFEGSLGYLNSPVEHLSHRSIGSMLTKTLHFSKIEAKLLFDSNHPKITSKNLIKVPLAEFINRCIVKQGYKDGAVGIIESIYQAFNKFIVYSQLWELQNKENLKQVYGQNDNK